MAVAAHLLEKGWRALFPVGENNRYDLVAEKLVNLSVFRLHVTPKGTRC